MIQMNIGLINKTVEDAISAVNFLCKNELSYFELNLELKSLNEKINNLQTLILFSEDNQFIKKVCAIQLITNNINNEISKKEFRGSLSKNFRINQIYCLKNLAQTFNIKI
ncbi:hypothetical protein D4A35_17890 (plasmid) [Paraclostridium bifermentans]|uniref:Uncharacterized protein n=2 Tax=Paraclostridium bifermentans TaxID=1490 RepID=A0A5P3XKE9_PARBF|nr:hypothetical protein [Paraclostridium bifermentans]QEZ70810.1 hypothetical protein D4A35_17890 [Paraclostridium bifermentans]